MAKSILPWTWGKKGNGDVAPIQSFRDEVDRLFDDFFGGTPWPTPFRAQKWTPAFPKIDMTESEKEIKLTADLPGLEEKDVQLHVTKDSLTLKGERKDEREEKGKDYFYAERSFGSFERTFPLSAEVDSARIEATLKKGVLTVILPKTAEARKEARKVDIKSA